MVLNRDALNEVRRLVDRRAVGASARTGRSLARCPKFMVVAELRKRLVISRWLEQRQEAPHYRIDRPGCVPNVKVDRIELVP